MYKVAILFVTILSAFTIKTAWGQAVFEENFDYPDGNMLGFLTFLPLIYLIDFCKTP